MSEQSIPYVVICHNVMDMGYRFNQFLRNNKDLIRKASRACFKVELLDGTILYYVTEDRYYNTEWAIGRIYKIYGSEQVYHGLYHVNVKKESAQ